MFQPDLLYDSVFALKSFYPFVHILYVDLVVFSIWWST